MGKVMPSLIEKTTAHTFHQLVWQISHGDVPMAFAAVDSLGSLFPPRAKHRRLLSLPEVFIRARKVARVHWCPVGEDVRSLWPFSARGDQLAADLAAATRAPIRPIRLSRSPQPEHPQEMGAYRHCHGRLDGFVRILERKLGVLRPRPTHVSGLGEHEPKCDA